VSNIIPISRGLNVAPRFKEGALVRFGKVQQDKRGFDLWHKQAFDYEDKKYELSFQVITFNESRKSLPGVIQYQAPLLSLPSLNDESFTKQCDSAATAIAMDLLSKADEKGYNSLLSEAIQQFRQNNPDSDYLLFDDLITGIQNTDTEFFNERDKKRVILALKGYKTKTSSFFAEKPEEVTDIQNLIHPKPLVTPITILDVSQLTSKGKSATQQNFVSQVCGQIYHYMQANRGPRAVELLLVLDEAQNYLPNPTDQYNYIRKLIQEGASLGVRVIVIGQVPQDIEMSARQQLKTLVLSHVPEGTIRYVTESFSLPDNWSEKLQKTSGGVALIINEKTAPQGGVLCNTFTSPQTVGVYQPEQIKKAIDSAPQDL
jgi:DNA helicase HerA-like ATPase